MVRKKKIAFNDLLIEITRKCNLHCAHCIRGDAQNVDMHNDVIDALIDKTDSIGYMNITGGEPTCNIDGIEYLYNKIVENNIEVNKLQIVTNGSNLSDRFADLMIKFYKWISKHKGSYNFYVEILISNDKYHSAEGVDADAALSFYRGKFKEYEHMRVVFYNIADKLIKPLGRARDIVNLVCPAELEKMYRATAVPKKTRIEVMASARKCLCPLRNYDILDPKIIRILCPVIITVDGNIASPSDESNLKNVISTVWSEDILSDIDKYNPGKPYCIEDESVKFMYFKECATKFLKTADQLSKWNKYMADTNKKAKEIDIWQGEVSFPESEEEHIKVYNELLNMRKSAYIMDFVKKHDRMPSITEISEHFAGYLSYFVEQKFDYAKEHGLIDEDVSKE